MELTRRDVCRGAAGVALVGLAGCSGGGDSLDGDIAVGPEGRLVFEPAELTVDVGERVSWYFDSSGHNVSARPEDAEEVRIPEGATPFASYGPDESARSLVPVGESFEHRFEVPGTYQYVCVPHLAAGMVGRVVVEG